MTLLPNETRGRFGLTDEDDDDDETLATLGTYDYPGTGRCFQLSSASIASIETGTMVRVREGGAEGSSGGGKALQRVAKYG